MDPLHAKDKSIVHYGKFYSLRLLGPHVSLINDDTCIATANIRTTIIQHPGNNKCCDIVTLKDI